MSENSHIDTYIYIYIINMYGVCELQESVTKRLEESRLSRRRKGGPQLYVLHLFKQIF